METSDSEYFESADEDFASDDETQIENTKVVQENVSTKSVAAVDTLTISDDNKTDTKFILKKDKKMLSSETSSNDDTLEICDELEKLNHGVTKDIPIDETENSEPGQSNVSQSYMDQLKGYKSETQIPPAVSTMSDKEDNMETRKSGAAKSGISATYSQQMTNTANIQQPPFEPHPVETTQKKEGSLKSHPENKTKSSEHSDLESTAANRPKRPEFGIPPARATCWFPGTANIQQPFEPHPAYLELIQTQNRNKANSDLENKNNSKQMETNKCTSEQAKIESNPVNTPKRPEFGIPPARTTCWVPGTANIQQPFEPHPAYLELLQKKKSNLEHDPETKNTLSNQSSFESNVNKPKRPEFGIPPARTTCWVPGTANVQQPFEPHPAYLELLKTKEEKEVLDTRDSISDKQSMLEDTDNTFQQAESSTTLSKPTITPKTSAETTSKNDIMCAELDQNDWNDDEDWGDFDAFPHKNDVTKPDKDEENMWEDDDWEPVESQTEDHPKDLKKTQIEVKSNWGGWGNWGLSSVLNTATSLTTQVSQGITNVLETGIGAPDPTELARINKLEKEKMKEHNAGIADDVTEEKPILGFGLGNLVQGVTKLVETTGTKVIAGGLDTLETIGKKTMEVLQENDPGLKKKRAFLKLDDDKPILSQLLREAKEKAEKENKELEKKHFAKKANYETLFDDHQGLVHLEALEMLSKQCDIKLQSLLEAASGDVLNDMQETLDQVKELCEIPEEDDEENLSTDQIKEKLNDATSEINVKISYDKLISTWEEVENWLAQLNLNISISVEQFHRAGELLLIKDHRSTADEADSLVQLTTTLIMLIGIVAARFSEKLNLIIAESVEKEEINSLITNVFLEAANSSSYIQDAFQLLIPVLQVGAV
ncbi:Protein of unknown function (DUF719) [Popillia japonica]|uniref:Protein FAM114A2 n=1 Tax=Popillia japonica TaxID=7064 RepID=A0AAW1LUY4_POPJA